VIYVHVGNYAIPDLRLFPSLVEAARKIYDAYPNEDVSDLKSLAVLLGHKSEKSGAFLAKMTFMRAYGLIEGRGAVRISEIGKHIGFGTDDQKAEAIKKAILNIPLWNDLYAKFGVNLPTDNFWAQLAKIAVIEAPEAQRTAEQVRNAYLEDIRYLPKTEGQKMEPKDNIPPIPSDTESFAIPGGAKAILPKTDMKQAWQKLKRTVDAYFTEEANPSKKG
jgi:hypothetical protein